jgi:hypothetical protein
MRCDLVKVPYFDNYYFQAIYMVISLIIISILVYPIVRFTSVNIKNQDQQESAAMNIRDRILHEENRLSNMYGLHLFVTENNRD